MKTITKLSLIAATLAAFTSSAALADDSQLQIRLALQRQAAERNQQPTTIAVYAHRHGVSQRSAMQDDRSVLRFDRRMNAKGESFGIYVPVK